MKKVVFILFFIFFSFNVFAFPEGVYPIESTRQEVETGVFIVQGTDGRWYQETGQNDLGEVEYKGLTGKEDTYINIMKSLEEALKNPSQDYSSVLPKPVDKEDENSFPEGYNGGYVIVVNETIWMDWDKNVTVVSPSRNTYFVDSYYYLNGKLYFHYTDYTYLDYRGQVQYAGRPGDGVVSEWTTNMPIRERDDRLGYIQGSGYTYTNLYPTGQEGNMPDGWSSSAYRGFGNPDEEGQTPENDPFNPDNPNYNPQLVKDIQEHILNLNLRVKLDWSEFWVEFDKRIPQLQNGGIPVEDKDKDNPFSLDDIDWEKAATKEDSWFVKLMKAIFDFFKGLIVPPDVEVTNSDGTKSKQNYFAFEFNNMHTTFSEKVPVVEQVGTLVNDLNTSFISSSDTSPDVEVDFGTINLMGDDYGSSDFKFKLLDFSFMNEQSRQVIHGVILLFCWLKFIIALPTKIQKLIRG